MVLKTKFVEDYLHADIAGKIELDNSIIKLRKWTHYFEWDCAYQNFCSILAEFVVADWYFDVNKVQLKGEFDNQFIYQRWDPETVWGDLKGKSDYWIGDAKKCNRVDIEVKYQENLQKWGIAPYHIENAAKENADLLYVTDGEILEEYNMHTKQRKYLADISEYWQNYCKAIAEHKILTPKIKISTRK